MSKNKNKSKRDQASTQNDAPFKKYEKPLTRSEFMHWLYRELKNTNMKSMTEPICNSTHDWIDYKGDRIHILITTEAVNKEKTGFDYVIKARIIHPGEKVGINMASGNFTEFMRRAKSMLYEDGEHDKPINNPDYRVVTRTFDYKKATKEDVKLLFFELIKDSIRIVKKEHLKKGEFRLSIYDEEMRVPPLTLPMNVQVLNKLKKAESEEVLKDVVLLALSEILDGEKE